MVRQPFPQNVPGNLRFYFKNGLGHASFGDIFLLMNKPENTFPLLSLSCDQHDCTFIHVSKTVIDKFSTNAIYCGMMTMMFLPSLFLLLLSVSNTSVWVFTIFLLSNLHPACFQVCSTREKETLSKNKNCNGPGHFLK